MSEGRVVSVNVGAVAPLAEKPSLRTGINKTPRPGRIAVDEVGLKGDGIGNLKVHGGPSKAVYLYTEDDYRYWETALGRPLSPGTFGENLTIAGLDLSDATLGERFTVGTTVIAITEPREPCATLGLRMGDPLFPKAFLQEGRTGSYARVVTPGLVWAGCGMKREADADPRNPTVGDVHRLYASKNRDRADLTRLATAPDATDGWRSWAEKKIGSLPDA